MPLCEQRFTSSGGLIFVNHETKNICNNSGVNQTIMLSYKATDKFLYEVPGTPEIHVVFKDSGNVLYVVRGVDAGQNKGAVHHQHCEEHHL